MNKMSTVKPIGRQQWNRIQHRIYSFNVAKLLFERIFSECRTCSTCSLAMTELRRRAVELRRLVVLLLLLFNMDDPSAGGCGGCGGGLPEISICSW